MGTISQWARRAGERTSHLKRSKSAEFLANANTFNFVGRRSCR
jgi:hypothetical protein